MWVVFKIRSSEEYDESDMPLTIDPPEHFVHPDPLDAMDDDEQTRIQTRPNLAIAKAAKPTPPHGFYSPNTEDTEDTEDLQIEVVNVLEHMTDEVEIEDVLGNDDTLPFMNSKWERPPN